MLLTPLNSESFGERLESRQRLAVAHWLTIASASSAQRTHAAALLVQAQNEWFDSINSGKLSVESPAGESLAQLAIVSGDPVIYATALGYCANSKGVPLPRSCGDLSFRTWAQYDPGNGFPWLVLAGQARTRNDSVTEASAYHRAAVAQRMDAYDRTLVADAQAIMTDDMKPLDRYAVNMQVAGALASTNTPLFFGALSSYCSVATVNDEATRRDCNALAEHMVASGSSLLQFAVGAALGAKLGWSAERVAALKQERKAYSLLTVRNSRLDLSMYSCQSLNANNERMAELGALGELGQLRKDIERSGRTVAELAQAEDEDAAKKSRAAASVPQ